MKTYLLSAADKAAMMAALGAIGMTALDKNSVEHFKAPSQCGFKPIKAVMTRAVVVDDELITPEVLKAGYWLQLNANVEIPSIASLPETKRFCDMNGMTTPKPAALDGVNWLDDLLTNTNCPHLLGESM